MSFADSDIGRGLSLLGARNVRGMFFAYLVSYSGTAMAPIAIAFGVLALTGSTSDASIVIAAPTLAAIVVLLIGGVIADRSSRQRVIYTAELVAMAAQLALAYLFISGTATLPWLTAFMLLMGISMAFHAPAATGFIVQLVEEDELRYVNALLGIARNGALALGAAAGGLMVATIGSGLTLLFDGITFAISAAIVFSLKPKPQREAAPSTIVADLKLGWQEFTRHTWLWVIVVQFSLIVAAGEALFGLIGPAVARETLGGAAAWGYIASGFGVGTLCGGIFAMRVRPKHPMYFATVLVFFFSLTSIALYLELPLPMIVLAAVTSGFLGQIFGVLWYTTLQQKVPHDMLSRVAAYDHLGSIALAPLGVVLAGVLYESIGRNPTLLILIATVIVPTALALTVRDVRTMTAD